MQLDIFTAHDCERVYQDELIRDSYGDLVPAHGMPQNELHGSIEAAINAFNDHGITDAPILDIDTNEVTQVWIITE